MRKHIGKYIQTFLYNIYYIIKYFTPLFQTYYIIIFRALIDFEDKALIIQRNYKYY